jgi:hypothetical protein
VGASGAEQHDGADGEQADASDGERIRVSHRQPPSGVGRGAA